MAYRDPLTGLANYRLMQLHLDKVLKEAERTDQAVGVMIIDLDNFKALNDHLGHPRADEVLSTVGTRLDEATSSKDMAVRMHGDEFVVIRRNLTRLDQLIFRARRITNTVNESITVDEKSVQVSCSIGIAMYPVHAEDKDDLLQCADDALYSAKRKGNAQAWKLYLPNDQS